MDFLFDLLSWFAIGYLTRDIFEFIRLSQRYRRKQNDLLPKRVPRV